MPDSQRYPLNLDLMNNVENPVVFQLEKGLILAIFLHSHCSKNT